MANRSRGQEQYAGFIPVVILPRSVAGRCLDRLAIRRLRPHGTTFSGRSLEDLADACASSRPASLAPSRTAHPARRHLVFGLEDAKQAADYTRRQRAVGKIVAHRP